MRSFTKIQDQIADKIDHLINALGEDEQCSQTANVCIKIVSSYHWQFSRFSDSYSSIEMLWITYTKSLVLDNYDSRNPPLLWIIWISNPFLDFNKEVKYLFSDQKSALDFSTEMHPKFREE